jgi:hypothetical protein
VVLGQGVRKLGFRKRNKKGKQKIGGLSPFWKQAIFWGLILGVVLAVFGVLAGSRLLGILGLLVGFAGGVLMKAIDKLPFKKGANLFKGNYRGGNRIPDIEETPGYPAKKKNKR